MSVPQLEALAESLLDFSLPGDKGVEDEMWQ
nr:DUF4351 domain-containing protein [Cylindrospermopsis raciborskii]